MGHSLLSICADTNPMDMKKHLQDSIKFYQEEHDKAKECERDDPKEHLKNLRKRDLLDLLLSIHVHSDPVDMKKHHEDSIKFHQEQYDKAKAEYDKIRTLPKGKEKDRKDQLRESMNYYEDERIDHEELLKNFGKREVTAWQEVHNLS
jgi:hypothetical protein